ncbi:response regulator containing a CheY-like receiver domain and a GGDEF domain [Leptolyngbya sp. PCC 7375]|nr:response regulator containing a CheY-like receiver domain and a GGDEF domain [Leptolyngbya sp. PCC 7375]
MPVIVDLDKKIKHYRKSQFTGILSIKAATMAPWLLYFLAGQIVWANTRTHAQRRWHRHLLKHCPELIKQDSSVDLTYNELARLVMRKQFSRERFSELAAGCISEILFDIVQQGTLHFQTSRKLLVYQTTPRDAAKFPCIGLQYLPVWEQAQQDWQMWKQANLIDILPNQAPTIEKPKKLQEHTSSATFRALTGLLDGQQTLRDLGLRVKQPLTPLTLSILPHIRNNFIRMVAIDKLDVQTTSDHGSSSTYKTVGVSPQAANTSSHELLLNSSVKPSRNSSTVLYIDDSPADSQAMEQIVQTAGYRYVNIADPLQALPQLLEVKPELIFLDLVMPIANGYELCAQIRRISAFRDIPIVIVTNNDGISDRVRAKVVGASGFMGKPIRQARVLKVLKKYMQNNKNTAPTFQQQSQLSPSV